MSSDGQLSSASTITGGSWNGGYCMVCSVRFLGSHTCSAPDLLRRAAELIEMANRISQPRWMNPPADPTASCPCRTENGGSGICGCVLGQQIICSYT